MTRTYQVDHASVDVIYIRKRFVSGRAPSGAEHAATRAYHAAKKAGTRQQSSIVVCVADT
ncbi:hypothetical protein BM1_07988 [Bipolaris maydis]|nr:hypothetical protein BM1_07988 [Bipolaris maydis]